MRLKIKEAMMKRVVLYMYSLTFTCVKTMLYEEVKVKISGFEKSRVDRADDGVVVMLEYRKYLKKIMVETKEIRLHNAEMLWKRLDNRKVKIVVGVIYILQKSRTKLVS